MHDSKRFHKAPYPGQCKIVKGNDWMIIHVLNTVLPVFAALFIGILCRKKDILNRSGVDALRKLAVDITLPAVLFSAFATADYSPRNMLVPLLIFSLCIVALLLGYFLKNLFKCSSILMPYLMTGFEAGMLGYGLFALLYPGQSSSNFAIIDLGQVLFVFTLYKGLLMGKGSAKELASQAFASPVVWAIIIGMLFGITGLYSALGTSGAVSVIDKVAEFIAAPTSCLILISIGYDLEFKGIPWKRVLSYTGMRVAVMALILALAIFTNRHFLGGIMHEGALVLMVILPAPYVLPIFTNAESERTDIASTLSLMTLLSLILFSFMAAMTL